LVIETSITPDIWINGGANVTDEWSFCQTVGKERCGPLLDEHYATFITNATIDKLATVDVNTVRIPTTYAAWVDVPGSELYRGNQLKYLREVTDYAISTYGMHVIIDLHSLPGK
jgi:glucan 1,3-beta-glucosidase